MLLLPHLIDKTMSSLAATLQYFGVLLMGHALVIDKMQLFRRPQSIVDVLDGGARAIIEPTSSLWLTSA
jgi:hypothetical protein